MINISLNAGTSSSLYLNLLKNVVFSGTTVEQVIELSNVSTSHYGKDKYITNGPINIVHTFNSLLALLKDKESIYYKFLQTFVTKDFTKNKDFIIAPFGYVNVQDRVLSITVNNPSLDLLEFGNMALFYGLLLDIMVSLKGYIHGPLVQFNNVVYINKVHYNYYQEVESLGTFYYNPTILEVSSLNNLDDIINSYNESDELPNGWRDFKFLNHIYDLTVNGYYDDAKSLMTQLTSNSFEKLWISRIIESGTR